MLLDIENGGGGWQPTGEGQRDSGMDRMEIYQEDHRTEYTDKGLGLYRRSLLGEEQFNFHVRSVLRVISLSKLIFL